MIWVLGLGFGILLSVTWALRLGFGFGFGTVWRAPGWVDYKYGAFRVQTIWFETKRCGGKRRSVYGQSDQYSNENVLRIFQPFLHAGNL